MSDDSMLALAAAVAAGPMCSYESTDKWREAFNLAAGEITGALSRPNSGFHQAASDAETSRYVEGYLAGISPEATSKRYLITYKPDRPGQYTKGGVESVRTARTDSDPEAQALADKVNELGKRNAHVRLHIVNRDKEKSENGKGYRTLAGIEEIPA